MEFGWATNGTGWRSYYLYKNGLSTILSYGGIQTTSAGPLKMSISNIYNLAAGDYLQIQVNHNAGTNVDLLSQAYYNNFAVHFLGA